MSNDKISGLLLAIPLVIIIILLVMLDKHYLNSRLANLTSQPKFRIMFMALIFITVMLSSFYWQTYIRL